MSDPVLDKIHDSKIFKFSLNDAQPTISLSSLESSRQLSYSGNVVKFTHIFPIDQNSVAVSGFDSDNKTCTWLCNVKESQLNQLIQISEHVPQFLATSSSVFYLLLEDSTIEIWDRKLNQPFKKQFSEKIYFIEFNARLDTLAAFGDKNIHLIGADSTQAVSHASANLPRDGNVHPLSWGPSKILAIGGDKIVRYLSGSKWTLYNFESRLSSVHSNVITYVQFLTAGSITKLVTGSLDLYIVWDFDEESELARVVPKEDWPKEINFFQKEEEVHFYYFAKDNFVIESLKAKEGTAKKIKRLKTTAFIDNQAEESNIQEDLFRSPTKHSISPRSNISADDTVINEFHSDSFNLVMSKMQKRIDSLEAIVSDLSKNIGSSSGVIVTPGYCPPPMDAAHQWCMFWNQLGHASKSSGLGNQTIHIHLFSGQNAGNIKVPDRFNCSLIALNANGYAVSADIVDSDMSSSVIAFSMFAGSINWERRTRPGEVVKALSLGTTFLAVVTSNNTLYLFSPAGSLLYTLQLPGLCVAIASHQQLLLVITKISDQDSDFDVLNYHHSLYLVNNVKACSMINGNNIVNISREKFSLPLSPGIDWVNISDTLVCHIKSGNVIYGLYPTGVDYSGNNYFQWVPMINVSDIQSSANSFVFPLYVDIDQLCYIKLRPGHPYPTSNTPVNFFGYSLLKSNLRIGSLVSEILPLKKYNTLTNNYPQLQEMAKGEDGKLEAVKEVVELDWRVYDEMRYRMSLYIDHFKFYIQLFSGKENVANHYIKGQIESYMEKINSYSKLSDKWTLRVIRKTFEGKETQYTARELLYMLRGNKSLDIAASIMGQLNQQFVEEVKMLRASS